MHMQPQRDIGRPAFALIPSCAFNRHLLGHLAIAAAVAVVLSACGGGGGDDDSNSGTPVVGNTGSGSNSTGGTNTGSSSSNTGSGNNSSTGNDSSNASTSYIVSTLAGLGPNQPGATDGSATVATFNAPEGVAVGPNGSLYVADYDSNKIRMIAADGTVSTIAGNGNRGEGAGCVWYVESSRYFNPGTPCATATLNGPVDLAVGKDGSIYVTEGIEVDKITNPGTASCTVSTLAGYCDNLGIGEGYVDGPGDVAAFTGPVGLTLDSLGNLYVVDTGDTFNGNKVIREITPDGVVTTIAGYVGHYGDTNGMGTSATFNSPWGIVGDQAGNLYVSDRNNNQIRKIAPNGMVSTFAGTGAPGHADGPAASATFNYPEGLAFDANGNLYVGDADNQVLRKITPDGQVTTLAGVVGVSGFTNGPANQATFTHLPGLAVDAKGVIYAADVSNNAIRKIAPAQ